MAVGGEGSEYIIALIVVLILIIVGVIARKLMQKRKSLYTYKYAEKSA
jgi:hypothetical protein